MSDVTSGSSGGKVETLDCRGLLCPVPIIRLSKAVKSIGIGDRVQMIATDPGSDPDMKAWEKQTGHKLVSSHHEGNEFHFLVEKMR